MLTEQQAKDHALKLIEKAKDYDEIGPFDLIDEIEGLTLEDHMQVWDAIWDILHEE